MTKIKFTTIILATLMAGVVQPLSGQNYRMAQQIAPGPRFSPNEGQLEGLNVPGELSEQPTFRPVPAFPPNEPSALQPQQQPSILPQQPVNLPVQPLPAVDPGTLPQNYQPVNPVHPGNFQRSYQPIQPQVPQYIQQQAPLVQQQIPPQYIQQQVQQQAPQVQQQTPYYFQQQIPQQIQQPFVQQVPQQYLAPGLATPLATPRAVQNVVSQPQVVVEQVQVGNDYFEPVEAVEVVPAQQRPTQKTALERAFEREQANSPSPNRVWGVSGLLLSRERFNDSVDLRTVSTGDVVQEDLGGIDVNLVTRGKGGRGWELRYFQLFDETATSTNAVPTFPFSTPAPALTPSEPIDSITRDSEIRNAEFNFIKQRQSRFLGIPVSTNESLYGFRAFQFTESLLFQTQDNSFDGVDTFPRVENLLLGFQVGRRVDKQLWRRVGVTGFAKLGVYNNRAEVRDRNFADTKDDVAFLGEADLAGTYTFNRHVRAKVGYRLLAATELALADDHLNTPEAPTTSEINSTGDLFLEGGYFGLEFVH